MKKAEPRVFVIDDDRSVRRSLANLLETEDHAVETFAHAEEYLARPSHNGPACLVLDVRLPGLDGSHSSSGSRRTGAPSKSS